MIDTITDSSPTGSHGVPPRRRSCKGHTGRKNTQRHTTDPEEQPTPLHLGFRGGRNAVLQFLTALRSVGVNHVVLNLKYGRRNAGDVLEEIGIEVLPKLQSFMPAEVAKATS